MRAFCLTIVLLLSAAPVWANARVTVLMDVLQIEEAVEILRAEGFAHAEILNEDILEGRGGAFWESQIRQIYTADQITERIRQALSDGLSQEQIDAVIDFYNTPETSRVMTLENAARRAMADPEVEQAARETYAAAAIEKDPHWTLVQQFIAINDLSDRNLSGTMSAYVQFYIGLSDGRFLVQSEADILAEIWSQEEAILEDTTGWLNGFLFMAYQPLPIEVLEAHVVFSEGPVGQALNAALFSGFESVNLEIAYALGRAVALNAKGDEI